MWTWYFYTRGKDWVALKSSQSCVLCRFTKNCEARTDWSSWNWVVRSKIGKWLIQNTIIDPVCTTKISDFKGIFFKQTNKAIEQSKIGDK